MQQIKPLKINENNKLLVSEIDLKKCDKNFSFICKMEALKTLFYIIVSFFYV